MGPEASHTSKTTVVFLESYETDSDIFRSERPSFVGQAGRERQAERGDGLAVNLANARFLFGGFFAFTTPWVHFAKGC